jgi:hypothetical protein
MAFPIKAGAKEQIKRAFATATGSRRREFETSQRRIGVSRELNWIQTTPGGDFVVRYIEGENVTNAPGARAGSGAAFDDWFRAQIKAASALDLSDVHAAQGTLIVDLDTKQGRGVPVAFAVTLLPGKAAANLQWAKQLRLDDPDFADMARRATLRAQRVWQYDTPNGSYSVLYAEAADPGKMFATWGGGQGTFDKLLRKNILELHGIDLAQPSAPPELVLDWTETPSA